MKSTHGGNERLSYKTKLKLDKEVGGGVLRMRWTCNLDLHTLLHTLLHAMLHTLLHTLPDKLGWMEDRLLYGNLL